MILIPTLYIYSFFITGAGGNLGSSVAAMFNKTGANLVLVDNSDEKLQRLFPKLIDSDQHLVFQGIDINNHTPINSVINPDHAKIRTD